MATPIVSLLLFIRESEDLRAHVQASTYIAYALTLGAGVFVYFHWRINSVRGGSVMDGRLAAWLTVGLVVAALQGLLAAVASTPFVDGASSDRWPLVHQLVVLCVLGFITLVAERVDVGTDPALVGAGAALVLTGAYWGTLAVAPPLNMPLTVAHLLATLVMLAGLLVASAMLQLRRVSLWVRRRLAFSVVALTGAHCCASVDSSHSLMMTIAIVANLVGAVTLCTMAQRLLRGSLLEHQQEIDVLQSTLDEVRADVQEDQELLHEVGATLAGIASASRIIQHGAGLTPVRRQRLEAMLAAEVARLERLMCARAPSYDVEYAIEDVIEPLVISHQARGRDVRWEPAGLSAVGDPDDLAEVVNILLENAARHGGGGTIRLSAQADGDFVEVTCSDTGPGVAPEFRDHLFTSGVRGPDSDGQGYGLAIAQRLMSIRGGSLDLVDSGAPGATFVARLPRIELSSVAVSNVA